MFLLQYTLNTSHSTLGNVFSPFRPRLHDTGMKLCRLKTITFSTIHTVPVELYLLQLLFISLLKFAR